MFWLLLHDFPFAKCDKIYWQLACVSYKRECVSVCVVSGLFRCMLVFLEWVYVRYRCVLFRACSLKREVFVKDIICSMEVIGPKLSLTELKTIRAGWCIIKSKLEL